MSSFKSKNAFDSCAETVFKIIRLGGEPFQKEDNIVLWKEYLKEKGLEYYKPLKVEHDKEGQLTTGVIALRESGNRKRDDDFDCVAKIFAIPQKTQNFLEKLFSIWGDTAPEGSIQWVLREMITSCVLGASGSSQLPKIYGLGKAEIEPAADFGGEVKHSSAHLNAFFMIIETPPNAISLADINLHLLSDKELRHILVLLEKAYNSFTDALPDSPLSIEHFDLHPGNILLSLNISPTKLYKTRKVVSVENVMLIDFGYATYPSIDTMKELHIDREKYLLPNLTKDGRFKSEQQKQVKKYTAFNWMVMQWLHKWLKDDRKIFELIGRRLTKNRFLTSDQRTLLIFSDAITELMKDKKKYGYEIKI